MSTILRLVCLVVLLTLMQQCWRTAGQTAYNEDQLKLYAKLCQQLRNEMKAKADAVLERLSTLSQKRHEVQTDVDNDAAMAHEILQKSLNRVDDVGSSTNRIFTPAVKVGIQHPYTDPYQSLLTNVYLYHGMGYRGSEGTVIFTKSGIYSMEYKMQSMYAYYSTLRVVGTDGIEKYTFDYKNSLSSASFYEMFSVEAGDKLIVDSMYDSYPGWIWTYTVFTSTFPTTYVVLRFLGDNTAATTTS